MGGTPKSSLLVGSSIIIHFGVPKKKYETPIYIYIKLNYWCTTILGKPHMDMEIPPMSPDNLILSGRGGRWQLGWDRHLLSNARRKGDAFIYVHACVYISLYIYICMHARTHACMHVCMYVCM